jgi:1,4-dihydroxy-2-naphthoate octaprenyltransferase
MRGPSLLEKFEQFALSFIDEDGYPASIPVIVVSADVQIRLKVPRGFDPRKLEGRTANLIANHITPLPSGGYTDKRYIVFRGRVHLVEGEELQFETLREYGWDEHRTPFPEYIEVSTNRARAYIESLGKKLGETFKPQLGLFWSFFRTVRLPFLLATLAGVLVGGGAAFYRGYFNPVLLLLTFAGLAFIHMGLNLANDYYDTLLGADVVNRRPTPFSGGSRALIYGIVSASEARILFSTFFAAGIGVGIYLALLRGPLEIGLLIVGGIFLSYFYTAPPFKLAYRGLGELAVFTGFGPLIVLGTYFVQSGSLDLTGLMASIPVGILIMLILYVNEIPDAVFDKEAGKKTLVARLSKPGVMTLLAVFLLLVYLFIAFIPILRLGPPTVLAAFTTAPLSLRVFRNVNRNFGNQYAMISSMSLNVKNSVITCFLIAAGYFVGRLVYGVATL